MRTGTVAHIARDERDRRRGYSISVKLVLLAYVTEGIIATASLIGAAIFAKLYGHDDAMTMTMMMLAPIGYAAVEISRVPLAIALRTQRSLLLRLALGFGVICAAGVTIKSMSQLGEIMFRPRLMDVVRVKEKLEDAKSAAVNLERRIAEADQLITQRSRELVDADAQLSLATQKLAALPEQKCGQISGTTRDGRAYQSVKCSADTRIAPLVTSVNNAKADRDAANRNLENARTARSTLDRGDTERQLATMQLAYREAVLNSQLHSFTAMVYGKDSTEVTDAEVHSFLRLFVFLPAICIAFAATLVAMAAVTPVSPDLALDDAAAEFILAPLAREIIRDATESSIKSMRENVERANAEVREGILS